MEFVTYAVLGLAGVSFSALMLRVIRRLWRPKLPQEAPPSSPPRPPRQDSGDREPRRPLQPAGAGSIALPIPREDDELVASAPPRTIDPAAPPRPGLAT